VTTSIGSSVMSSRIGPFPAVQVCTRTPSIDYDIVLTGTVGLDSMTARR
jgi:hypothetical protein